MRTVYCILILIALCSCSTPEYKICEFETKDPELKLYHDILTELIEQHFYNGYLGEVSSELESKYPNRTIDFADTAEFKKDMILLQNKLFNNTAKFKTICYRPTLKNGPWKYFYSDTADFFTLAKADTAKYMGDIKAFLTSFSLQWESVADTIAQPQTRYTGESFNLCTSKVIPCGHYNEADIGVVGFSKVFYNGPKNKGLLYYEFTCGGKCGMGEIILVEFVNKRWTIKQVSQLWIS